MISDIDGTVTRSDILGHVCYLLGKDWERDRVIDLYLKIRKKGYQIVYLSARSLDQIDYTRGYLAWANQSGKHLPDGPAIVSPNGIYTSFAREIASTAHNVKITALMEILQTFPHYFFPFYAGLGNKKGDATAYLRVGIDKDKIFIFRDSSKKDEFKAIKHFNEIIEDIDQKFPPIDDYQY